MDGWVGWKSLWGSRVRAPLCASFCTKYTEVVDGTGRQLKKIRKHDFIGELQTNVSKGTLAILHRFLYEICGDCGESGVDDERDEEHEGREAGNGHNRQCECRVELQFCL